MADNQYITIMLQSLQKKEKVLNSIIQINKRQKEELENPSLDPDDFDKTVEEKSELIEQLKLLDNGFEKLYEKVREELQTNKEIYQDDLEPLTEEELNEMDADTSDEDMKQIDEPEEETADITDTTDATETTDKAETSDSSAKKSADKTETSDSADTTKSETKTKTEK